MSRTPPFASRQSFDVALAPLLSLEPSLLLLLMARLSLLKILLLSLFAATNANPLLSQQQPIANPDSPVHTTDGWDWKNCGQSFVELHHVYHPHVTLPSPQGFSDDLVDIKSITVFPDPPKPGKDLTVTVHATTEERVDVRRMYQSLIFHTND
jgi:hypothetical protein